MDNTNPKVEDIIVAVRTIAAENPAAVYTPITGTLCFYTLGLLAGKCGCHIGQAIIRVAPHLQHQLEEFDKRGQIGIVGVLDDLDIPYTFEQGEWLRMVQQEQDGGRTLQEAIAEADIST